MIRIDGQNMLQTDQLLVDIVRHAPEKLPCRQVFTVGLEYLAQYPARFFLLAGIDEFSRFVKI